MTTSHLRTRNEEPAKATVASLFHKEPQQWGRRGDPFLWRELAEHFQETPLPATEIELLDLLLAAFREKVGQPISSQHEWQYVERFAHHGMSKGQVSFPFWRTSGFPLLLQRYQKIGKAH